MYHLRESWTDGRMDDFARRVDQRFDAVDRRFEDVDRRFDKVDREIHDLRSETKAGFDKVDARFEAMQRLMLQSSVLVIAALIGLIATQL
jgi:hypothetical protein